MMQSKKYKNLCELPSEEQEAIEDDKARWLIAHKMVRDKTISEIKEFINSQDELESEDWRMRLNTCYKNNSQKR